MKCIIDRVGPGGIVIVLLLVALAIKTLPATAQEGLALPAAHRARRRTSRRSTIVAANAEQAAVATAYIVQLNQTRAFKKAIVTTIEMGRKFYTAEKYHQDFLVRNPTYPYIVYNDLPKIENLKRILPGMYRASPVLVSGTR